MVRADGADQGIASQLAGLDAVFLAGFKLVDSEGYGANGGKNGEDGKKDGKNGFDGNTPKLVVFQFCFLGAFESEKLMEGEKITMILPASIDGDGVGDNVVGNAGHRLLTNRTDDGGITGGGIFRRDGV